MIMEGLMLVGTVISALCFGACYGSMNWLKVKQESLITTKRVGKNGLKILHISDLHSNSKTKINLNIWTVIEKLDFDLVTITGDFVQDYAAEIQPHLPYLKKLVQRVPVFFVEGNHEKKDFRLIRETFKDLGIEVLENKRITVFIKDSQIDIVGLIDFYKLKKNKLRGLHQLFGISNSDNFTLVLSHQPQIIDSIKNYKADLILSGHTHGGQVRFPFLPALFVPGQGILPKYDHGWYHEQDNHLYISKGIGATHFHVRFFNRPEIAIIHVKNE